MRVLWGAGVLYTVVVVPVKNKHMHSIHTIWWLHAMTFAGLVGLQALWIALELDLDSGGRPWSVIFLPTYALAAYWGFYVAWVADMRIRHKRHGADRSGPERLSWSNIYLHSGCEQHYEQHESACDTNCGPAIAALHRSIDARQGLRILTFLFAVTLIVLTVIRLDHHSYYAWSTVWYVAASFALALAAYAIVYIVVYEIIGWWYGARRDTTDSVRTRAVASVATGSEAGLEYIGDSGRL